MENTDQEIVADEEQVNFEEEKEQVLAELPS